MIKEYLYLGFGLEIIGALLLVIVATSSMWHGKYNFPFWRRRYYWHTWRPFYKNTETLKWKIKWNRIVLVFGWIPPKHKLNWIGFLFILIGIFFQVLALN